MVRPLTRDLRAGPLSNSTAEATRTAIGFQPPFDLSLTADVDFAAGVVVLPPQLTVTSMDPDGTTPFSVKGKMSSRVRQPEERHEDYTSLRNKYLKVQLKVAVRWRPKLPDALPVAEQGRRELRDECCITGNLHNGRSRGVYVHSYPCDRSCGRVHPLVVDLPCIADHALDTDDSEWACETLKLLCERVARLKYEPWRSLIKTFTIFCINSKALMDI